MKKTLKILLAILLVSTLVLTLTACNSSPCEHEWQLKSEVPATCTAPGGRDYECTKCGVTRHEGIAQLDHTPVTIDGQPATCKDAGLVGGTKCADCGRILTPQEVENLLPHSFEVVSQTPASCTTNGSIVSKCSVCGAEQTEVIPAAHTWIEVEVIVEANCYQTGERLFECEVCGEQMVDVIAMTEHKYLWIEATEDAIAHYHCNICGTDFDADKNVITDLTPGETPNPPAQAEWQLSNVTLEKAGDKVYFVFNGTHSNYQEAELKALLGDLYFDMQKRGDDWYKFKGFERVVSVDMSANTWTLKFDVTDQELHANPFTIHFAEEGDNGVGDLKLEPAYAQDGYSVNLNGKKYTIVNKHGSIEEADNWGVVSLKIANLFEVNPVVTLEASNDKMYVVITGTHEYDSAEELKAVLKFDAQNPDTEWSYTDLPNFELTESNGTFTAKVDISSLPNGQYFVHVGNGIDVGNEYGIAAIEANGKLYSYVFRQFEGWSRYVLNIENAPTPGEASYQTTGATLASEGDKVYFVISGTHANYEEAALRSLLENRYFDFEERDGDWTRYTDLAREVEITAGAWSIKIDVTEMPIATNPYTAHFGSEGDNLNLSAEQAIDGTRVTLGGKNYTLVNHPGSNEAADNWGAVSLRISDANAKSLIFSNAALQQKGDRVYLVLTGTVDNYTKEELESITTYDDDNRILKVDSVELADGIATIYFDFTDTEATEGGKWWFCHWTISGQTMGNLESPVTVNEEGIVVNNKKYQLKTEYGMPVVVVTTVAGGEQPTVREITITNWVVYAEGAFATVTMLPEDAEYLAQHGFVGDGVTPIVKVNGNEQDSYWVQNGSNAYNIQIWTGDADVYEIVWYQDGVAIAKATYTPGGTVEPEPGTWALTKASLVVDGDKVYFVYSGTYANYEEAALQDALKGLNFNILDYTKNFARADEKDGFETIFVFNSNGEGTWSYKTEITAGTLDGYYAAGELYYFDGTNADIYQGIHKVGQLEELGSYKYEIVGGPEGWPVIAFRIIENVELGEIPAEYDMELKAEAAYVGSNLVGRWVYYHYSEDTGAEVGSKAHGTYNNGTVTLYFTENVNNWWCTQLFYKNPDFATGSHHKVQLTVTADFTGSITINGTVYELVAGEAKTISFEFDQSANATLSIQLGINDGNVIAAASGTLTIADVQFDGEEVVTTYEHIDNTTTHNVLADGVVSSSEACSFTADSNTCDKCEYTYVADISFNESSYILIVAGSTGSWSLSDVTARISNSATEAGIIYSVNGTATISASGQLTATVLGTYTVTATSVGLTKSGSVATAQVEVVVYTESMYLTGIGEDWSTSNATYKLTKSSDNKSYEINNVLILTKDSFKIVYDGMNSSWSNAITNDGNDFTVSESAYYTVKVDISDTTPIVTVTKTGDYAAPEDWSYTLTIGIDIINRQDASWQKDETWVGNVYTSQAFTVDANNPTVSFAYDFSAPEFATGVNSVSIGFNANGVWYNETNYHGITYTVNEYLSHNWTDGIWYNYHDSDTAYNDAVQFVGAVSGKTYTFTFTFGSEGTITNITITEGDTTGSEEPEPTGTIDHMYNPMFTNGNLVIWFTTSGFDSGDALAQALQLVINDSKVTPSFNNETGAAGQYKLYFDGIIDLVKAQVGTYQIEFKLNGETISINLVTDIVDSVNPQTVDGYVYTLAKVDQHLELTVEAEVITKADGIYVDGEFRQALIKNPSATGVTAEYWLGDGITIDLEVGDVLTFYIGGVQCTGMWIMGSGVDNIQNGNHDSITVTISGAFKFYLKDYSTGSNVDWVCDCGGPTLVEEGTEIPDGCDPITITFGGTYSFTLYLQYNGSGIGKDSFSNYCIYAWTGNTNQFGDWTTSATKGRVQEQMTSDVAVLPTAIIIRWGSNFSTQTVNIEYNFEDGGHYLIKMPGTKTGNNYDASVEVLHIQESSCSHEYTDQYQNNGDGTHSRICNLCEEVEEATEQCENFMQYQSRTWSEHTYVCSKCGYDLTDEHNEDGDDGFCTCGYKREYFIRGEVGLEDDGWAETTTNEARLMDDEGDGFFAIYDFEFKAGSSFQVKANFAGEEFVFGFDELEDDTGIDGLLTEGSDNKIVVNFAAIITVCLSLDDEQPIVIEDAELITDEEGDPVWTLVTDASTLSNNDQIIIVYKDDNSVNVLGASSGTSSSAYRQRVENGVTLSGDTATDVLDGVAIITLEADSTAGRFALKVDDGYLYAASGNYLPTKSAKDANSTLWDITIESGTTKITSVQYNTRRIQYNSATNGLRFAAYTGSQNDICIYKLTSGTIGGGSTGGGSTQPEPSEGTTVEFDISAHSWTNAQEVTTVTMDGGVVVSWAQGTYTSLPKYYTSEIRFYAGNQLTIAAPTGKVILSVTFTFNQAKNMNVTAGTYNSSNYTWTGSVDSVTFTNSESAQAKITGFTVTYGDAA